MSGAPANPERLLLALDENLDHQVQLIIYGRSALWLGFDHPPAVAAATFDVDAIIPDAQVQALADDARFWDARDAVNRRFKAEGLYITHLFPESEVFLRRNWAEHIIPITRLRLNHLELFRPATVDLVLTKMMRGNDEQDMADAEFMIGHDRITEGQLMEAFSQMKPLALVELRDAFARAKPVVLELAREATTTA
ncbi:MAG: hypothetical protein HS113_15170 [Verrucomicrobiales bacterium]|nr:hypothetical protein [Verrucomicrobiales bacterium]